MRVYFKRPGESVKKCATFYKTWNLHKTHELYAKILNENTWAVYG